MAITLTESAKLAVPDLYRGIVQTITNYSTLLRYLPFTQTTGSSYDYIREATNPTAGWYDPGDSITAATTTFTRITVTLKRIIADADVDEFAQVTRSGDIDQAAAQISGRIRAVVAEFEQAFVTGDSATNAKKFDGLRALVSGAQRVGTGGNAPNGAVLTLDDLDRLRDLVIQPSAWIMTSRSKRKIASLARSTSSLTETRDELGMPVEHYAGLPVIVLDSIGDNLTKGTNNDTSEIYCVSFAKGWGVHGLYTEQTSYTVDRPDVGKVALPGPQVLELGPSETVDARRYRVRWYTAIALYATKGAACLDGVRV